MKLFFFFLWIPLGRDCPKECGVAVMNVSALPGCFFCLLFLPFDVPGINNKPLTSLTPAQKLSAKGSANPWQNSRPGVTKWYHFNTQGAWPMKALSFVIWENHSCSLHKTTDSGLASPQLFLSMLASQCWCDSQVITSKHEIQKPKTPIQCTDW